MTTIVPVSGAAVSRSPYQSAWLHIEHILTGTNGDVFNLDDANAGLILMQGVRGLDDPPFEHYHDELASLAGSEWMGMTEKARDVYWPMGIYSDSDSEDWVLRYRRFFKALNPRAEATWTVRAGQNPPRHLQVRRKSSGDRTSTVDPYYFGWGAHGIELVAADPFWKGDPISRRFEAAAAQDFTDTDGGPPFFISPRNVASSATMPNPGDVDAAIVWEVQGPQPTGVSLGFDTYVIDIPFEILDGETVTVDTRPRWQVVTMQDGSDVTASIGPGRDLGQGLPPGTEVPLSIDLSGTGSVTATLTPLYWSALA